MPLQDPELEKLHADRIAALKVRISPPTLFGELLCNLIASSVLWVEISEFVIRVKKCI